MTMTEFLEKDKDRLIADLSAAGDPVRAQLVMSAELDRVLIRYNEQCEDEKLQEAAGYMIGIARMALTLTDCIGDVKIWEQKKDSAGDRRLKLTGLSLGLLILGGLLAVFAAAFAIGAGGMQLASILTMTLLLAGSVAAAFFSGALQHQDKAKRSRADKGKRDGAEPVRTEFSADAGKLYRALHGILLSADQSLQNLRSAAEWEKRAQEGEASGIEEKTLELCVSLLEALSSGDGEYALERLEDVKYYLHVKGIEAVSYTGENADLFDLLPGARNATVRPALTEGGTLLKKGLATQR